MKSFMALHPNIKIRIITTFISRFVGNMVFPFMAIYFATEFGVAKAGALIFLNVIVTMTTSLFGGYVSDRVGRKKMMVIAQGIQILAFGLMALANSPWLVSAILTFIMMLVQNISSGLMNPAAEAMLIDVSTPENRRFMYSINYWATNLSIAIGTIIGGFLFHTHRFALFATLTLTSCIIFIVITWMMSESHNGNQKTTSKHILDIVKEIGHNYRNVMSDRYFLIFCLGNLLVLSLEFQTNNYIAIRLQNEFHANLFGLISVDGLKMLSWIRVENTVLVVLCTILVNQWMSKFKPLRVFYMGIIIYTLGYTVLGFSNLWFLLLIAILVATLGELMYVPVCQSIVADLTKENVRGSYMAIYGFVFQGAKIMSSVGVILGAFLPSIMMAFLFLCLGLFGLYAFFIATRPRSQKFITTKQAAR
nr:MFS transporter [Terrilactibacillus laevilacticus]